MINNGNRIDWTEIPGPVFLRGNRNIAYRDPAAHYYNGVFRVYHTQVHHGSDDLHYSYTAVTQSTDLIQWTKPEILTPKDQKLNFSSPGNIIRYGGKWLLCLQTYPTPENQPYGDDTARIFIMRSDDLIHWSEPEMIMVKGPDVPVEQMGRMIDPYLVQDKNDKSKWWCFYKQNGASMSFTHDFETWTYSGRVNAGENSCVLIDRDCDEYILIHSPGNGIGIKRSGDLVNWADRGIITLDQENWPWAEGRLTAGHVLDMRDDPEVGKYVMFFHGSVSKNTEPRETHGHASLAIAWSDDLSHWDWPGSFS